MTRSAAIAAAYMLAVSQGGAMLRDDKAYGPTDYLSPRHASHDAERIAKAEAKRARKAAKRAQLESRPGPTTPTNYTATPTRSPTQPEPKPCP